MAAIASGIKEQVILQGEENGTSDIAGNFVVTLVEEIPAELFPDLVRDRYSPHPRFSGLAVSKVGWTRAKHGKFYRVTYTYEGYVNTVPEPVYTLSASLAEEPIELHNTFQAFAGKPSAPLNGAIFIDPDTQKITSDDNRGVFREFKSTISGAQNPKAGVESFLHVGATWTEISFSTTRPTDLGDVGTIDTPSGPQPTIGTGRDWIYSGAEYTRRGKLYEIRKTWLLSGKNGWDADIY